MNIAIIGSREYPDWRVIHDFVYTLPHDTTVVSGGARGVDRVAESVAKERGLATRIFPADWNMFGKRAGFLRNQDIINAAEIVVAFWDGTSRGTAHSLGLARAACKPVYIVHPGDTLPVIAELARG